MNIGVSHAIAAAALFGLSVPLAKLLVGDVHPIVLAGLFYMGSGAGLGAVMVLRRILPPTRRIPVAWPQISDMPWFGAAILSGGIAAPALLMFGFQATTASAAAPADQARDALPHPVHQILLIGCSQRQEVLLNVSI